MVLDKCPRVIAKEIKEIDSNTSSSKIGIYEHY
jgi:hypothetical protein